MNEKTPQPFSQVGWTKAEHQRAQREGKPLTCIAIDERHLPRRDHRGRQRLLRAARGLAEPRWAALLVDLLEHMTLRPEATYSALEPTMELLHEMPVELHKTPAEKNTEESQRQAVVRAVMKELERQVRFAGLPKPDLLTYAKEHYGVEISPEQVEKIREEWRKTWPAEETARMEEMVRKMALEEVHRDVATTPLLDPAPLVQEGDTVEHRALGRRGVVVRVASSIAALIRWDGDETLTRVMVANLKIIARKKKPRPVSTPDTPRIGRAKGPKAPQERTKRTPKGSNARTR